MHDATEALDQEEYNALLVLRAYRDCVISQDEALKQLTECLNGYDEQRRMLLRTVLGGL